MTELHELLSLIVLNPSFRSEMIDAITQGNVKKFLEGKGYSLDDTFIKDLSKLDLNKISKEHDLEGLDKELFGHVGLDPAW
jgi:hypothetical protein